MGTLISGLMASQTGLVRGLTSSGANLEADLWERKMDSQEGLARRPTWMLASGLTWWLNWRLTRWLAISLALRSSVCKLGRILATTLTRG